jgi:sterol desaturase/sphingolipid hydroxylase (fatty acid hydroxylase superfamily)
MIGFVIGLLYSNGFEYFFHRWALHRVGSRFAEGHSKHHESSGKPDQEEHLNFFSGSAVHIVIMFAVNAIPFLLLEWGFDIRVLSGVLIGFVVYFILMEEVHRRAHTDIGRIPSSWRTHHMLHHGHGPNANEDTNFNIFCPVFDWLLGTKQNG